MTSSNQKTFQVSRSLLTLLSETFVPSYDTLPNYSRGLIAFIQPQQTPVKKERIFKSTQWRFPSVSGIHWKFDTHVILNLDPSWIVNLMNLIEKMVNQWLYLNFLTCSFAASKLRSSPKASDSEVQTQKLWEAFSKKLSIGSFPNCENCKL